MIEWDTNARRLTEYALKLKEEMPWLYESFFYQFDPYHTELIKQIYYYTVDYIAEEKYQSKRHTFKNIYVVGSWFGLQIYDMFNDMRKDQFNDDTTVNFTFIDRNRDYIKSIGYMQEIWNDKNISSVNADVVFEDIDFSEADLVIMPYAEEIMPIQHLNLNITCPIVAAFTQHRYQRARNRNFAEPIESITDIHMQDLQRRYLKKIGNNDDDWVYTDIVTMDLTQD